MMVNQDSRLLLSGQAQLTLRRWAVQYSRYALVWDKTYPNLVVTDGKTLCTQLIADEAVTAPSHIAMGSDGQAVLEGMTDLQGIEHERQAVVTTRIGNQLKYATTLGTTIGADVVVNEFGIFNAASAGTMLARFLSQQFTMGVGDLLDVNWTLTVG